MYTNLVFAMLQLGKKDIADYLISKGANIKSAFLSALYYGSLVLPLSFRFCLFSFLILLFFSLLACGKIIGGRIRNGCECADLESERKRGIRGSP